MGITLEPFMENTILLYLGRANHYEFDKMAGTYENGI